MLSSRVVRPQPHHGTASAASSSSSRRHMVDADAPNSCGGVPEWEVGLPSAAELTPVSQPLIPPALAAAFGIGPADAGVLPSSADARFLHDSPTSHLSSRFDDYDEEEGEGETEDAATGGGGGRGEKKARMVWTPSLHHRFVEAVEHLGEKGAVPKAIVRLMNVDGLTRENVASHLQKYRLYLKRSRTGGVTATQPPQSLPPPYFPRFGAQAPRDTANLNSCWKKMQNSKLRHKAKEEDASSVMKMNPLFFKLSLGSLDELSMDGVSCKRLSSLWRCEHNKYGNSS